MKSISRFVEKRLRLKVNREKSAVDCPWKRVFLGFSMTCHKRPRLMNKERKPSVCWRKVVLFRSYIGERSERNSLMAIRIRFRVAKVFQGSVLGLVFKLLF